MPPNKIFGLFFSFLFSVAFVFLLIQGLPTWSVLFGTLSIGALVTTLIAPEKLKPFNKLWFKFGLLLARITSVIILAIIFYGLFSPIAIAMRFAGRDELRLKKKPRNTYWKERHPIGPEPQSFKTQF